MAAVLCGALQEAEQTGRQELISTLNVERRKLEAELFVMEHGAGDVDAAIAALQQGHELTSILKKWSRSRGGGYKMPMVPKTILAFNKLAAARQKSIAALTKKGVPAGKLPKQCTPLQVLKAQVDSLCKTNAFTNSVLEVPGSGKDAPLLILCTAAVFRDATQQAIDSIMSCIEYDEQTKKMKKSKSHPKGSIPTVNYLLKLLNGCGGGLGLMAKHTKIFVADVHGDTAFDLFVGSNQFGGQHLAQAIRPDVYKIVLGEVCDLIVDKGIAGVLTSMDINLRECKVRSRLPSLEVKWIRKGQIKGLKQDVGVMRYPHLSKIGMAPSMTALCRRTLPPTSGASTVASTTSASAFTHAGAAANMVLEGKEEQQQQPTRLSSTPPVATAPVAHDDAVVKQPQRAAATGLRRSSRLRAKPEKQAAKRSSRGSDSKKAGSRARSRGRSSEDGRRFSVDVRLNVLSRHVTKVLYRSAP